MHMSRKRKGQLNCSRVLYREAVAVVTTLWITNRVGQFHGHYCICVMYIEYMVKLILLHVSGLFMKMVQLPTYACIGTPVITRLMTIQKLVLK